MRFNHIPATVAACCILTALCAPSAHAQLRQEITVEHQIVPEQREATRLNITPHLTLRPWTNSKLDYSTRTITSRIIPAYSLLEPERLRDSILTLNHRGYVSAGYMPGASGTLSAGIKVLDTHRLTFNAWLQGGIDNYRSSAPDWLITPDYTPDRANIRSYNLAVGADLTARFSGRRSLDVGVNYNVNRYTSPSAAIPANRWVGWQTANDLSVKALLSSPYHDFVYSVGAEYRHFGYASQAALNPCMVIESAGYEGLDPVRENSFKLLGKIGTRVGPDDNNELGLDVTYNQVIESRRSWFTGGTSETAQIYGLQQFAVADHYSHGLLTARPYFDLRAGKVTATVAAKVEFTFNSGKFFHIAPDVNVAWRPSYAICVYAEAGGGEWQNTLWRLYQVTPYSAPNMAYANSHIPLTVRGGFTVGPFRGAWARIEGAYAIANEWLMPDQLCCTSAESIAAITIFSPVNMRGYRLTAQAGYNWNNFAEITATYNHAPSDYARGWYHWADRARNVLDIKARVSPLEQLDITASWQLRGGRRQWITTRNPMNEQILSRQAYALGHLSILSLGGDYRLTDNLSGWLRAEIPLASSRRIGGIANPGVRFTIGASYKF